MTYTHNDSPFDVTERTRILRGALEQIQDPTLAGIIADEAVLLHREIARQSELSAALARECAELHSLVAKLKA